MKKLIAAILVALIALSVFGCGDTGGEADPPPIDLSKPTPGGSQGEATPEPGLALVREPIVQGGMVAAGSIHSLGLRTDGSVLSGGHDLYGQRAVSDWSGVIYIAAGKTVSVGVKADGTVVTAGTLSDASALDTARAWLDVYMADAGDDFVVALLNNGTVVAAGDNSNGQCDVAAWSDMVWVAAGASFTVGLKADGTVLATSGAPAEVTGWARITKLAAGGASGVAGIDDTGKLIATVDAGAFADGGYTALDVSDAGIVAIKADGSVNSTIAAPSNSDFIPKDSTDITAVSDVIAVAVGEKHAVVMDKAGNAFAYGDNVGLQCDVGTFNLRPYVETLDSGNFLRGLPIGSTVEQAKGLVTLFTGAADVSVKKADGTDAADADVIATGMTVAAGGSELATIVVMGDGTGDGAVDSADISLMDAAITNKGELDGAYLRAIQLNADYAGNRPACTMDSKLAAEAHIAGTGAIDQFGIKQRGTYSEAYAEWYEKNNDTVGYMTLAGTNIDYPIMFDKKGTWYYNDYSPEKEKVASASIYTYYYGYTKNTIVTGHNSRPSGSMFHQLHHIQEANLGQTTCAETKYCGKELGTMPDLSVYGERVWELFLYGEESRWEIFSMYETGPDNDEVKKWVDDWYDNTWYPYMETDYSKQSDEEIQTWLDKVRGYSSIEFDTTVTVEDDYMTIFVCGNNHDDSNDGARLFFMLKRVG